MLAALFVTDYNPVVALSDYRKALSNYHIKLCDDMSMYPIRIKSSEDFWKQAGIEKMPTTYFEKVIPYLNNVLKNLLFILINASIMDGLTWMILLILRFHFFTSEMCIIVRGTVQSRCYQQHCLKPDANVLCSSIAQKPLWFT